MKSSNGARRLCLRACISSILRICPALFRLTAHLHGKGAQKAEKSNYYSRVHLFFISHNFHPYRE